MVNFQTLSGNFALFSLVSFSHIGIRWREGERERRGEGDERRGGEGGGRRMKERKKEGKDSVQSQSLSEVEGQQSREVFQCISLTFSITKLTKTLSTVSRVAMSSGQITSHRSMYIQKLSESMNSTTYAFKPFHGNRS